MSARAPRERATFGKKIIDIEDTQADLYALISQIKTPLQNSMAMCGLWLQYWTEMIEYFSQHRKFCWTALE